MEVNFSFLKQKDVINLNDGKNMGKVCDLSFTFPENNVLGFTVTGCKGFKFSKQEVFIPIKNVIKIGKDAVLVKYGDKDDKPDCPPPCPPKQPCPPPCPPNNCPPPCPPPKPNRRSYDEYE
ncbi:MAG: PRC-barrel domain-containing protein [Clostridia bacterium]|nr:PRC-barrel domain-containing protein [Clostridia bacterium]